MAGDKKRPEMTQRIVLCAPAAFRSRGATMTPSVSGEKIFMPAPGGWYSRRARVSAAAAIDALPHSPQQWHGADGDSKTPAAKPATDTEASLSTITAQTDNVVAKPFVVTASQWLRVQRRRNQRRMRAVPVRLKQTVQRGGRGLADSDVLLALAHDKRVLRYGGAFALLLVGTVASAWLIDAAHSDKALAPVAHVDVSHRFLATKPVTAPSFITPAALPALPPAVTVAALTEHAAKKELAAFAPVTITNLPIVVVAPTHIGTAEGLDLDISSPHSLWAKAGARYGIDPVLIYSVALVETRATQEDGSIAPSPWMVRINGHLQNGTRAQSEHAIELADMFSVPVQDVGIMQVYYPMHRDIEPNPIALLNPIRNIDIGTSLLRKAMRETKDPVLQIGYYHSHDAQLARGYGQLVLDVYHQFKGVLGKPSAGVASLQHKSVESALPSAGG